MRDVRPVSRFEDGERNRAEALIERYIERREGALSGRSIIIDTRISVRDIVQYWREPGRD